MLFSFSRAASRLELGSDFGVALALLQGVEVGSQCFDGLVGLVVARL